MSNITIDEFLSLRKLLNGVDEDYYIAINNLDNLMYNDKALLDLLLVKSLQGVNRKRFIKWTNYWPGDPGLVYTYQKLLSRNIYSEIKRNGNKHIYKQILILIMRT